jgi:antitoxin component HigA of HigAB toxin-antitoxin module
MRVKELLDEILMVITKLMILDPEEGSLEGRFLKDLTTLVSAYESELFPITTERSNV